MGNRLASWCVLVALAAGCRAGENATAHADEVARARAEASAALAEAKAARSEARAARELVEKALQKIEGRPAPLASSGCSTAAHTPKPGAHRITFSDKGVALDGKLLPEKPRRADVERALGQADRVSKLANDILVYEGEGIIAYQKPGTDQITQITVFFGRSDYTFMPRELFPGALTLDGSPVDVTRVVTERDLTPTIHLYPHADDEGCLVEIGAGFQAWSLSESKACNLVESFDECKELAHCSAVRLIVTADHKGPIWRCDPKQ